MWIKVGKAEMYWVFQTYWPSLSYQVPSITFPSKMNFKTYISAYRIHYDHFYNNPVSDSHCVSKDCRLWLPM